MTCYLKKRSCWAQISLENQRNPRFFPSGPDRTVIEKKCKTKSEKKIRFSPAAWSEAKSSRFYRKNRYFFCSTDQGLCKSKIKEFSNFFRQHGSGAMQVENQRIFKHFSAAWLLPESSRNSEKKRKICIFFLGASAADGVIKICPQWAGNGPVFDYAMRPEPGWRWGWPLRRDSGESAQTKPARAAGDLCYIWPPRGGRSVL